MGDDPGDIADRPMHASEGKKRTAVVKNNLDKAHGRQDPPKHNNYAGRMKTMIPWADNANQIGSATTTWNHDLRGFLTNKAYQGGTHWTKKWGNAAQKVFLPLPLAGEGRGEGKRQAKNPLELPLQPGRAEQKSPG